MGDTEYSNSPRGGEFSKPVDFSPRVEINPIFSGLIFATANPAKLVEYEAIAGHPIVAVTASIPEIELREIEITMMANGEYIEVAERIAERKARAAYQLHGQSVVVEGTCLFVDRQGGWPGPQIGDLDSDKAREILVKMFNRTPLSAGGPGTTAIVTLAVYCPGGAPELQIRHGVAVGRIAEQPKGNQGWGWDEIFRPTAFGPDIDSLTYSQLTPIQKNMISMRAQAVQALKIKPFIVPGTASE